MIGRGVRIRYQVNGIALYSGGKLGVQCREHEDCRVIGKGVRNRLHEWKSVLEKRK